MNKTVKRGAGASVLAAAVAIAFVCPSAALAELAIDMADTSGNTLAGEIDINDLESQEIVFNVQDEGNIFNGGPIGLYDSNGNYISGGLKVIGGQGGAGQEGDVEQVIVSFNPGVLVPGESYTVKITLKDNANYPTVVDSGQISFTVGSSQGSSDEGSAGTGGGDGGGDGTGSGDGSGSGSGGDYGGGSGGSSDSGGSSSGSDSGSGGGIIWGGSGGSSSGGGSGSIIWGGSGSGSSAGSGDSSTSDPAGDSGTTSDPVISEPVSEPEPGESAGDDSTGEVAGGEQESAQDAPSGGDEAPEVADGGSQDDAAAVAAAAATKGGGGGTDGDDPESEGEEQAAEEEQAEGAAQAASEGDEDGTVLAEMGQVYQLLSKLQEPAAKTASLQLQPTINVTGIPWLLAAMLALLLAAGPAGLARRLAGYRRGLSAPTRLTPAAAAAGAGPDPDLATLNERHDA